MRFFWKLTVDVALSLLRIAFLLLAPVISVRVERLGLDVVDLVADLLTIIVLLSVGQRGSSMR